MHQSEWKYATNIVSKLYIEDVLPKTYIDDVKLQMDAKLWAEEYNRHCPPKQVRHIQHSYTISSKIHFCYLYFWNFWLSGLGFH